MPTNTGDKVDKDEKNPLILRAQKILHVVEKFDVKLTRRYDNGVLEGDIEWGDTYLYVQRKPRTRTWVVPYAYPEFIGRLDNPRAKGTMYPLLAPEHQNYVDLTDNTKALRPSRKSAKKASTTPAPAKAVDRRSSC